MNNAKQLLFAYLESIRDPRAAGALFADDARRLFPLRARGVNVTSAPPTDAQRGQACRSIAEPRSAPIAGFCLSFMISDR
ncbi:hypothetical protein GWK53_15610 [Burkholderia cepacia]|uniref:hypothetical protein n=1 Tax=Burkholderia cepacia TaxID=292 RepID=UPI0013F478E2|nr:hypothetical protein [Burkholderia cepacia]NHB07930.1 hypothetical protein [Burkholderia cepacia]